MKQAKAFFLRRIAAVLAILMVVVMFPVGTPAMATETLPQDAASELATAAPMAETAMPLDTTADGLEYYVYSDHVEITDYIGSATALVIPAEIEGLPVTSIGSYAFYCCSNLTSITFGGTAPGIHASAFDSVTATAYYPANYASWSEAKRGNYGTGQGQQLRLVERRWSWRRTSRWRQQFFSS